MLQVEIDTVRPHAGVSPEQERAALATIPNARAAAAAAAPSHAVAPAPSPAVAVVPKVPESADPVLNPASINCMQVLAHEQDICGACRCCKILLLLLLLFLFPHLPRLGCSAL